MVSHSQSELLLCPDNEVEQHFEHGKVIPAHLALLRTETRHDVFPAVITIHFIAKWKSLNQKNIIFQLSIVDCIT